MMAGTMGNSGINVRFWGTRGSFPIPGHAFEQFGGNTACVEIRLGDRLFILDAGSGLNDLGLSILAEAPPRIDILLSHLHLDHVMGLPFFKPAFAKGREIVLHCGNLDGRTAQEPLSHLFGPPIFPVTLDKLPATLIYEGFKAGETLAFEDGIEVRTHLLNHPAGATGYRFDHGGRSVCYLSDLEHGEVWPDPSLVDFAQGADLCIFDAMFTEAEYGRCVGWGHSTWQKGVEFAKAANIGDFAVFHHNPYCDDAALLAREAEIKTHFPGAFLARQGTSFTYDPRG